MGSETGSGPEEASDVLLVEQDEGYRVLTLNRPEALNAFNQSLWVATADALRDAAADDDVRCVVITGTGRAFSAGQDLNEMADPSVFEGTEPGYRIFMPVLETFPKPVIAAVNGVGVGIGLTMLLHCDIVLISDAARLRAPFISLGVTTEASASLLLPVAAGWQRAAELLLTEPWLDADAAVDAGLALRKVPAESLMEEARALAAHVGSLPLAPVMATKQLLLAGRADAVRLARERELEAFEELVGGIRAAGTAD